MEPHQIDSAVINSTDEALDMWAFVEVMGHSKIAGRLTTRKLGVQVMLQVDVLKPDGSAVAFSKLYSPASIFSITPVTEDWCRRWSQQASRFDFRPVPYMQEAAPAPQLAEGATEGATEGDQGTEFSDYDED